MNGTEHRIAPGDLLAAARGLKAEGWRFVTITGLASGESDMELIYHFDRNLELAHLRLTAPRRSSVPSLTPVYLAALLAENELQDLADMTFQGLAPDFKRTLYLDPEVVTVPLLSSLKPPREG